MKDKIKSGIIPEKDNEITLFDMKAVYYQKGDSCSDDPVNSIEIETQDAGGGTYFILKTERWAFESADELINIINDFLNRFNLNNNTK